MVLMMIATTIMKSMLTQDSVSISPYSLRFCLLLIFFLSQFASKMNIKEKNNNPPAIQNVFLLFCLIYSGLKCIFSQ